MERKFIFSIGTALLIFLLFIIGFIKYILFGFVLFILARPLYMKLNKYILYDKLNAVISLSFIIVAFLVIATAMIYYTYKELIFIFTTFTTFLIKYSTENVNLFHNTLLEYISPYIQNVFQGITNYTYSLLISLPYEVMGYFLSFIVAYYLLVYEDKIEELLNKSTVGVSLERVLDKSYKVLTGQFLFWGLQSALSFVGFYLLGVNYALVLSILIFIFAVIPLLGPWTVWGALAIYYIQMGEISFAIFSILYGILFISVITEFLIKPLLVGRVSDINPLIVFLGVIGGLKLLGIAGLLIGPILLEVSKDIILLYLNNKNNLISS